ncbi:MAG: STY4851/ECs_5259 family protein [Gammaproteobacteria bacterium]|nr:STY4851/ECs_5259 family protein [Gammaproteobacteria bacterium]
MTVLNELNEWTASVFKSRRDVRRGSPLWAYKITDHELGNLQTILQRLFSTTNASLLFNRHTSCLACPLVLYISTWLQRNTRGRPTWESVTSSICLDYNASSRALIVDCVKAGLKTLGITIHFAQNYRYLDTLYCHGGFPRADLLGISHSHLIEYFENVLDDYATFSYSSSVTDVAQKKLSDLPETLRQQPFAELASSLISYLIELRDRFQLYETSDPLASLEMKNPNWRDQIPFLVIDEEAQRLIYKLVKKTSQVVRRSQYPVRLKRYLTERDNVFTLVSEVYVNHTIHPSDLNRVFAVQPLPNFFELVTITDEGKRHRTASFSFKTGANPRWIVSVLGNAVTGQAAARELKYELYSDGECICAGTYRNGERLDEHAPWSFEVDSQSYNYLGSASLRATQPSLLIASCFEPIRCTQDAKVNSIGNVSSVARNLYKVEGHIRIPSAFGDFHVRTNSKQLKCEHVNVKGRVFLDVISDKPVYIGKPNLVIDESKPDAVFNKSEFFWVNSKGVSGPYFELKDSCGIGAIVRAIDGEVVWIHQCVYLHEAFFAELIHNGKGEFEVKFSGLENAKVGLVASQTVSMVGEPEDIAGFTFFEIKLTDLLADSVEFNLFWLDNPDTVIELKLPVDLNAISLITRSGHIYRDNDSGALTAEDLINCTFKLKSDSEILRVKADLFSDGKLQTTVSQEMTFNASGIHKTLPARAVANLALRLFRHGINLEDAVRLTFFSNGQILESQLPWISRFKYSPEIRGKSALIRKSLHLIKEFKNWNLKLSPTWDLARDGYKLECIDRPGDYIEIPLPEIDEYGRWLLWAPGQNNIKPTVVEFDIPLVRKKADNLGAMAHALKSAYQSSQGITDFDERLKVDSLQYAIKYLKKDGSRGEVDFSLMDRVLKKMANNAEHEGWSYFDKLVDLIEEVEPANFHALKRLMIHPSCLTLLLLRDKTKFQKVWELADYLPFEWSLIPIEAWIKAINAVKQKNTVLLEGVRSAAPAIYADFQRGLFSDLISKGSYFSTLVDIALVTYTPDRQLWANKERSNNTNSFVGNQFLEARNKLFERHQHKLMSISQSVKKDLELIECIEKCWPVSSLPSDLRGFFKSQVVSEKNDVVKRAHKLTIDLPLKVAFYNLGVFQRPLPTWATSSLSFALSQLQQFDRGWMQEAMSFAAGAAYSAFCNSEITVVG